ncbi:UNVERIFIED_CONTAM: hypothetical protein K2H54_034715 [Gekko kuhli]
MAPKKGSGVSKGKQPAPKKNPKRPAPTRSSSEDEDDAVQHAIMSRLQAVEQAIGVQKQQSEAVGVPRGPKETRSAANKRFQAEILTRLSLIEGRAASSAVAAGVAGPSDPNLVPVNPSPDRPRADEPPVAPPSAGLVARQKRLKVLICGHSYIFWAAHRARRTSVGTQLGLSQWAQVEWLGRRGLQWAGLLRLLFQEWDGPPPDVLMVHLGGNDLGLIKGKALVLQAGEDLRYIRSCWPGTVVVWSAIVPRRVLFNAIQIVYLNKT